MNLVSIFISISSPSLTSELAVYHAPVLPYRAQVVTADYQTPDTCPSRLTPLFPRLTLLLQKRVSFWFATGGAGFCLSRALTEKMRGLASGGKFTELGDKMRLPDDVTMGYVVEALAKVPMTKVEEFHSHLEPLRLVSDLHNQISFSYSTYGDTGDRNIVNVSGFSEEEDPTRFRSLHCHLNPHLSMCQRVR